MTGCRPFALIKPVELHGYRSCRVGACFSDFDDPRSLQAVHLWLDHRTGRLERCRPLQGAGLIVVGILVAPMLNAGQQPESIAIGHRMT
ncbi:hypothetical protein D3C81_2017120 [compost metagenome]